MLTYDQVVPSLIEQCEGHESCSRVGGFLLVRTLQGRVRLVLRGADTSSLQSMEAVVARALGAWFEGPIISPEHGPAGLRRLATHLWKGADDARETTPDWRHRWPQGWPEEYRRPGTASRPLEGRWEALQVAAGKDPWLSTSPASPPWPMIDGTPRITAFYGFKGGVGRTTTLAVLAWRLAQAGQRVVCVDLDLEAPGLSSVLLREPVPENEPGVIDAILTHAITGKVLAPPPVTPVSIHGVDGVFLAHAGHLSDTYVEKLARLDIVHREEGPSPVHAALNDLLKVIRSSLNPDHILIDCRSGLHDLAGLALHDLTHVDVLVGRGDSQELNGLRVLLPPLLRRRAEPDQHFLILRTFHRAPVEESEVARQREDLYGTLADLLYKDQPPAADAEGVAHDPSPISALPEIAVASSLGGVSASILFHDTFGRALSRLYALWQSQDAS